MSRFSADVGRFTQVSIKRIEAATKGAVQRVAAKSNQAQGKGGQMPVDTGFLRASQQAKIGAMPTGPSDNPATKPDTYPEGKQLAGTPVATVLLTWKMDMPLYVGWTANYARFREYEDGFLRGAVQLWPKFMKEEALKARAGIK